MLGRRDFGHVAFMLNAQHPGRPLETRFSLVADNLSKIFPGLGDSLSGTISIGLPPRGSGVEIAPLHDELLGAAFGLDDLNARVVEYRQDVRTEWAERFNTPGSYAVKDADGPADPSRATPLTDERSILTEAPTPHHRTQALPESFAKTRKAQLDSVTDGALAALAVEITDPGAVINDKPVWTLQEIHDNFFRKGDWGTKFPLTYSFPQVIPAGYLKPNGDPKEGQEGEGFSPFHQSQINATIALMDLLGDIIAPDFTNAGLTTDSVFRFSNTTQEAGGGSGSARANGPWQPDAVRGDVWIYHDVASNFDLGLGETGRATLAHEIGHILGLAHPGEYDASDEDPATYENSAEYFQDSNQYTIMSYFGASNTQSGERTGPEDGFLLHDIYALQRKYGVEMSTRTGDTTYGYNANTGGTIQDSVFNLDVNHSPRFTIWDAGGEDTLDASGMVTPAELDLRPGSFSSIGSRLNGSVTIPAGETIARFEIETVTDSLAESEETFTLTLSRNRSGTNLPSDLDDGNIGILATGSIWDTTDAPILISVADSTVTEGDDLVFTFSLDRADPVDVTVDWSVNFSTASAADLTPGTSLSGTLVIPAGDVEAKLAFPTVADILDETTETLRLSLSNPSANARVAIDPTNFIGTIHDPGVTSTPTVTLSSARGNEGETLGFVVSLDQAREKETKLFYDVLPDTVSWHDLAPGNSYTHNVSIAYDSAVDDTDHDPFKKRDVWIENAIGGAGDDLLQGNDADNRMFGGAGNDIFYGGAGNDSLGGGSGDDTFYGGAQVDDFYGGDGRDTVFLESVLSYWHVDLEGGTAVNEFWSEAFEDIEDLTTSYGNDIIELSNSDNSVSALDGDDIIYSAGGGIDLIYGGFGQDLLSYERLETGVTVNLQNLQFQGVFAQGSAVIDNLIHSIENLTGSEFDDNIRGNSGANSLLGLGGDDVIRGTAYHNYLHGGLGDDTIVSGTGNDTAVGGNGTDLLSFSESGVGVTVALYLGTAAGADIGVDTWFGMEGLIGSDHSDHLAGSMESDTLHGGEDGDILESLYGHDTAYGGAGRDTIFLDTEAPPPNQTGDIREGDDVGYGGKGLDVVYGGGGNDSLFGDEDEDYLFGGDDDDQLFGGEDNDTLNGGDGDDLLDGDAGFDFADYGSAGAGVVVDLNIAGVQQTVGAGKDTLSRIEGLFGSVFDDHFIGTTHSGRALYGQGGSDTLQAGTGDDSLFGGTQDDLIRDALGNDTIDGGSGTDTYEVLAPHSSVKIDLGIVGAQDTGGGDTDIIIGIENLIGSGYGDLLIGDDGANLLSGEEGDDLLFGMAGDDRLQGGVGNDSLSGGLDDDTLVGGSGDDTLSGGLGSNRLFGGDGSDTASYAEATGGVEVRLGTIALQQTGGAGLDLILGVENLTGSIFDDTLIGDGAANIIVDGPGSDTVTGNGGTDTFYLGQIEGDQYDGGSGTDLLIVDDPSVLVVDLHLGIATGDSAIAPADALVSIENVHAGSGPITLIGSNDTNALTGSPGNDTLDGGAGGDTLDGGAGSDTADYSASGEAVVVASDGAFAIGGDAAGDVLTDIENLLGSAFADFLRGDGQANVLTGGAGADYIQGRGGDDTLNGGENDDLLEPGAGADTVDGGAGQDLLSALDAAGPVTIDLGNVALSSAGYADKTLISIEGVLGVAGFGNTLVGGGGEDLLIGGDVADSIAGAGGADILLGLGGADTISGGAGDDLILGLEGDDVLTGDAGRDLFLFEPGDGADVVTDFELPVGGSGFEDRLFFSGLGLTFADLDIAEVGGDVVIGYGTNPAAFDGSVTVEGVTLAELVPGGAQPDWILVF